VVWSATMLTLCIDVGGTGIKGNVFDDRGGARGERVRIDTPRPATPEAVLATIVEVGRSHAEFDRIACGFPGVVTGGVVMTAPNLDGDWRGFDLAKALADALGKPARVANDADVQGLAVIEGKGVEMVLTLGTGLGSGLYIDGHCVWNLEFGHHPWNDDETYEDRVDDAARKEIGNKKWEKRVRQIPERLAPIFNYRRLYLGGGNASRLDAKALPEDVRVIDNAAGMLGGLKLWEQ
jgi:polyphosphate glucokinase